MRLPGSAGAAERALSPIGPPRRGGVRTPFRSLSLPISGWASPGLSCHYGEGVGGGFHHHHINAPVRVACIGVKCAQERAREREEKQAQKQREPSERRRSLLRSALLLHTRVDERASLFFFARSSLLGPSHPFPSHGPPHPHHRRHGGGRGRPGRGKDLPHHGGRGGSVCRPPAADAAADPPARGRDAGGRPPPPGRHVRPGGGQAGPGGGPAGGGRGGGRLRRMCVCCRVEEGAPRGFLFGGAAAPGAHATHARRVPGP